MEHKEILNLRGALLGEELEFVQDIHIEIEDGIITHIGKGFVNNAKEYRTHIALPPLVNAHTHTSDYALIEYGVNYTIKELVGDPYSKKYELLSKLSEEEIKNYITEFLNKSLEIGVFGIIDFREQGIIGSKIANSIKNNININYKILGRLEKSEFTEKNLIKFKNFVDGYGLPSISYHNREELSIIKKIFSDKIRAVHVSETVRHWLLNDLEELIQYFKPNMIVHGTNLSRKELEILDNNTYLVICPRSNFWFGVGIPRIVDVINSNLKLLIGTDNAGWNDYNIFKDLELALYITRLQDPLSNYSLELLKAVSVNGYKIFGLQPIQENSSSGLVIVRGDDIFRSNNKYLAIIKRFRNIERVINLKSWSYPKA